MTNEDFAANNLDRLVVSEFAELATNHLIEHLARFDADETLEVGNEIATGLNRMRSTVYGHLHQLGLSGEPLNAVGSQVHVRVG